MAKKWYISEKYLSDKEVSVRPRIVDLTLSPKSDIRFPQVNLLNYFQELIDDGDIVVTNLYENVVTVVENGFEVIVSTTDENPTITTEVGVVTISTQSRINYIIVRGSDASNDANGNITISIADKEMQGNISKETIAVPLIQKTDTSAIAFGDPSPTNPYSVDLDNNPSVKIVGIGTTNNPLIAFKLFGLTNTYDKYSITILPL